MNSRLSTEDIVESFEKIISNYDRDDILYWLSAISVFPGNEIYQSRFEFLFQSLLALPEEKFGKTHPNEDVIKKLLKKTNLIDWRMYEDWIPISKIGKDKKIFMFDKYYLFFPGDIEFPEKSIENIFRFFYFEKQFKAKFNYSPLEELKRVISYQDILVNFIIENEKLHFNFNNFQIPTKDFVDKWRELLLKESVPFSDEFKKSISIKQIQKPANDYFKKNLSDIQDIQEPRDIMLNPIFQNKIYLPSILIISLYLQLLKDLKNIINEENRKILKNQIFSETLTSILEQAPPQVVLHDFKINSVENSLDFGIIFDKKFFIFCVLEETFDDDFSSTKLDKIQGVLKQVNSELEKDKLTITSKNQDLCIDEKLEPFFILVTDDISFFKTFICENKTGSENLFVLSISCLRHIFEDLKDNSEDLVLLAKIFKRYNELRKESIIICFTFCDFYETLIHGAMLLGRGAKAILIDPHTWSNAVEKKMKTRPVMDLSPSVKYPPFIFRIKKFTDNVFFGYNNLIRQWFYCFIADNIQIYFLVDKERYSDPKEADIANFLSQFYTYILEHLETNNIFKKSVSKKIAIRMIPFEYAAKNKILNLNEKRVGCYIGINKKSKDDKIFIFDPDDIQDVVENRFDDILTPLFSLIEDITDKKDNDKIIKLITDMNLRNKFRISKVSHFIPVEYRRDVYYPTIIDMADSEMITLSFIRENFKDGIYCKNEANDIVKKVFDCIEKLISEKISKFELKNFVEFAYSEFETALMTRVRSDMGYVTKKGMKLEYDPLTIVRESEEKLNWYSPCCRLLIEEALAHKILGNEKITVEEWKNLIALTRKLAELSNMSDYLFYLSEILDIKLEINTKDKLVFRPIIENSPFGKYFEELMKVAQKRSMKEYPPEIPEEYKKIDLTKKKEVWEKEESKELELKKLDISLEKYFGFKIFDYGVVLNSITHLENKMGPDYLVKIKKDELIDFLWKKTGLNKKVITNVLDFSTLSKESFAEPPEYGKISTRKNRLIIKPFIVIDNEIIFGISTVVLCAERVFATLLEGKWPYSIEKDDFPKELKNNLDSRSKKVSKGFENQVYESIKKFTNFLDKNICQNVVKNDKCLSKIKEPCPGQIDVLSIHEKCKTIVLWEAKNLGVRFGSSEISGDIEEFVSEKGYINKLKNKENYIRRNLKEILSYYKIEDVENWRVESVFVFSALSVLHCILSTRYNSILWDEIEEYLKSKNCSS